MGRTNQIQPAKKTVNPGVRMKVLLNNGLILVAGDHSVAV